MERKISFAALAAFSLALMLAAPLAFAAGDASGGGMSAESFATAGSGSMGSAESVAVDSGAIGASGAPPFIYALMKTDTQYTSTGSAPFELGFVVSGSNQHSTYACAAYVDGTMRYVDLNVKDGKEVWFMAGRYRVGEHPYFVQCR